MIGDRSSTFVAHTKERNLWGLNTILEIFKKGTLHTTDRPNFQNNGLKDGIMQEMVQERHVIDYDGRYHVT